MKKLTLTAVALLACASAFAKLPTPVLDDAAKAKAAEAAAKTAWQAKVDAYKLCQAQDRVAAQYRKTHGASAATMPAKEAKPAAANGTAKAEGGGTPVAAVTTAALPAAVPPCADPGPFAYAPPAEKPLETSGAHSPAPTAASPPSVRAESAKLAPAKK